MFSKVTLLNVDLSSWVWEGMTAAEVGTATSVVNVAIAEHLQTNLRVANSSWARRGTVLVHMYGSSSKPSLGAGLWVLAPQILTYAYTGTTFFVCGSTRSLHCVGPSENTGDRCAD